MMKTTIHTVARMDTFIENDNHSALLEGFFFFFRRFVFDARTTSSSSMSFLFLGS